MKDARFQREADLVAAFCAAVEGRRRWQTAEDWTAYHETAGWDLLLVHETGAQIGIEAKLKLNAKVLEQSLPGRWAQKHGPDFRAVLVPQEGLQLHLEQIALHLGITIICLRKPSTNGVIYPPFSPDLPPLSGGMAQHLYGLEGWPNWCPAERCKLPDYVPDVTGGHAAPTALTPWKVQAIKLMIILERRGFVTRRDMKALKLSPSRWTDLYYGFLSAGPEGGYVRNDRTPDFKAQHPTNWAQIEADYETWSKGIEVAGSLFIEAPNA